MNEQLQRLSTITNQPKYKFGYCDRYQRMKVYTKEAEKELKGRESPGPIYLYNIQTINLSYTIPKQGIDQSQEIRNESPNINQKLYQIDIDEADKYRRSKSPITRFGIDKRFRSVQRTLDPPYYNPQLPNISRKFSFGIKEPLRFNKDGSTPPRVGPGRYNVNQSLDISQTIPKTGRFDDREGLVLHQTHAIVDSFGKQVQSLKKTSPSYSVGKGDRSKYFIMRQDLAKQSKKIVIKVGQQQ